MVDDQNIINIRCPACHGNISVRDVRGASMLSCPYCHKTIKITTQARAPSGTDHIPSREEIDPEYEPGVSFFETFNIIRNIVRKDIISLWKLYIVLLIAGIITALFLGMIASEFEVNETYYYDEYYTQSEHEQYLKDREGDMINVFYGISILVVGIISVSVVGFLYGFEVKRGTIRLLSLYPISMNGITIAKIISSAVIIFIIQFFVLILPFISFMQSSIFPWLFSVFLMAYFINILILITGAFGSQIITSVTGRLMLGMNRFIGLLTLIYFLLTQTIIYLIGFLSVSLRDLSNKEELRIMHNYDKLGKALSQFSPYHSGGRLIQSSHGHNTGGPDLHFILIIGIILIIAGYYVGRKIPLDVFIRES